MEFLNSLIGGPIILRVMFRTPCGTLYGWEHMDISVVLSFLDLTYTTKKIAPRINLRVISCEGTFSEEIFKILKFVKGRFGFMINNISVNIL